MKIEIEKPVIPQFVADWIKTLPGGMNIKGMFAVLKPGEADEIIEWSREVDGGTTFETLATAFLYGYEVEKELHYYAKVKGWELLDEIEGYWNWRPVVNGFCISSNEEIGSRLTSMSKHEWSLLGINDSNADFEEVG